MIVSRRWHRTTPATRAGYRALQACVAAPSTQTRWLRHILTVLKPRLNRCLTMSCHDRSAEVSTRVCCQVVAGGHGACSRRAAHGGSRHALPRAPPVTHVVAHLGASAQASARAYGAKGG